MPKLTRRSTLLMWSSALAWGLAAQARGSRAEDDPWRELQSQLFPGKAPEEDRSGLVQLFVSGQAEDAAIIPASIRLSAAAVRRAKVLTLVIDRNPAPVAAAITFAEAYRGGPDIGECKIDTRIRLDAFSRVRAILETTDGALLMSSRFVAGAGGCSAAPSKDIDQALASLGASQVRTFDQGRPDTPQAREVQIMLRHPNFTGMQLDPKSGHYTPARYVEAITVSQGNEALMQMELGISISENPTFRFTYGTTNTAGTSFTARDNTGATFHGEEAPPRS